MPEPTPQEVPQPPEPEAKRIFREAPEPYRELIKKIIKEEREVMHMERRPEIHKTIYNLVKRNIPAAPTP